MNRIGEAEQERLGLFTEEMGESQLEIGKILRHGIESSHPDDPDLSNAERLELEAGHVLAAIDLLVACGTLSLEGLQRSKRAKFQKLRSWLHCGTNLDAVEELLRLAEHSDAEANVGAARVMLAEARASFRRQAMELLVVGDDVGKLFAESLEQAIGDISPYQAIHALRRYISDRQVNRKAEEEHASGDKTFLCGKRGGFWSFAPSTLRDGWPPVPSGCCGSSAWVTPLVKP